MADDTPIGDFLTEHPEVANARVRVWFCPAHRDGTVEWRGDTAHCTTDDCALTSTTLKTPAAWSALDHVTIHDPDGWRRDGKPFSEPITHTEFMRRLFISTIERHVPASSSRAHAHGEGLEIADGGSLVVTDPAGIVTFSSGGEVPRG